MNSAVCSPSHDNCMIAIQFHLKNDNSIDQATGLVSFLRPGSDIQNKLIGLSVGNLSDSAFHGMRVFLIILAAPVLKTALICIFEQFA